MHGTGIKTHSEASNLVFISSAGAEVLKYASSTAMRGITARLQGNIHVSVL